MSSLLEDRFEYSAHALAFAFAGDSDGAVVVSSSSGAVVGLHVELGGTQQHARKRKRATSSIRLRWPV